MCRQVLENSACELNNLRIYVIHILDYLAYLDGARISGSLFFFLFFSFYRMRTNRPVYLLGIT